ncbi:MAG: MerR family transcriptional regulator [Alistipes sp.]|nr:MerR family transcriptional regulator [Alistipes sp.]MBR0393801.1 MerR family transcriptional regulator [Alistipes sp.]
MAEKLYYSMGEVAEMFDVNPSLIRYWGSQFDALRPKRNKKGNRMFTPADVQTLKMIYHLVKERKMTLEGARKALKTELAVAKSEVAPEVELLERLQNVRAMLVQVRETLGADDAEVVAEDILGEETLAPKEPALVVEEPVPAAEEVVETVEETPVPTVEETAEKPKKRVAQAPKKSKVEPAKEERPLPFYEQTLF